MSSSIAIIPARGGSKRIPKKNIYPFMGRPMIEWTIDAAIESGCFDKVLVSTDEQEIADCAKNAGAEVPFLRQEHADDHATVSQAVVTALHQAEQFWSTQYPTVVQLMPNCPLRTAGDIRAAIANFDEGLGSFQISVFRFGWMNPWWALKQSENGKVERLFPEHLFQRSQDLPVLFCPSGAIWISESNALKMTESFYGSGSDFAIHELPWERAVDIDDRDDLRMAEAIANMLGDPRAL